MKNTLSSWMYWKLAWRNLRLQPKQTLLTIAGGCIGAALIMASIIFFQSFDKSGSRWLQQHYGPIDWELKPTDNHPYFTADDVQKIEQHLQLLQLHSVAAVKFETSVSKVDGNLGVIHTGVRHLAIGLASFAQTAAFEPTNPLWNLPPLAADQVILSEAAALPIGVSAGDTVMLMDSERGKHYFHVKKIVKEEGITGYRGDAAAAGTFLLDISAARKLAGLQEGTFTSLFTRDQAASVHSEPTYFPIPSPLFQALEQKQSDFNQVQKMKQKHGATFVLCSITAVIAGTVLMLQVLFMLTDSRMKTTALLRAIGFQRRQTQRIFFIEAFMLQCFSMICGLTAGIPVGYFVITLFQWMNRDLLFAYSAQTIPISPYVSLSGILLAAGIVLGLFAAASVLASRKLRALNIVAGLRGEQQHLNAAHSTAHRLLRIVTTVAAAAIVLVYSFLLITGTGTALITSQQPSASGQAFFVFAAWLLASISSLFLLVHLLPFVQRGIKPLLRRISVQEAAQLLAFRYPAASSRRTFNVMLLFSICFTLLILVIIITQHNYRNIQQKPYTALGYPAYIAYTTTDDKERTITLLNQDADISEIAKHVVVLEPLMLQVAAKGLFASTSQLNLIGPDPQFVTNNRLPLTERAPEFASDHDAWQAVLQNPDYVIVDHKYSYAPEEWSSVFGMNSEIIRKMTVGESFTLDIYEKPPAPGSPGFGKTPEVKGVAKLKIAGFAESSSRLEFYNAVFVHPQMYDKFKVQGYRWESTPEKGYILLPLPSNDSAYLRQMEQRISRLGITGFYAPGISEAGEDIGIIQMLWIFNGFMILTMGIGLAGLAIVQLRAVQERSKIMAMLRCIGFSTRMVRQMLLLEGTLIGWIGLMNGLVFGSVGGHMIISLFESTKRPTDPALPFYYPWEFIVPVTGFLMLLTLWLNWAPSKRLSLISPGEAIRAADE
ncbi:ABC transporter permease [Paenibacillaceae bacterium]|nr:ABC transporter permease [Paenibacillaceae bacterium]